MRRTFNYTGRHRIHRDTVSIRVYRKDGIRYFDADLQLSPGRLPADARVFVDAYYERASMRFDFGTIGALKPAGNRSLEEIDFGKRILFRIKVVDLAAGHGKLLGVADGIVPVDADDVEGQRDPLLPVDPKLDMGQEIWRVAFDSTGPVLQVNQSIDDVMGLFRNNRAIAGLVYPQVLRSVLNHIVYREDEISEDAMESWQRRWLRFSTQLTGAPEPMLDSESRSDDEIEVWISAAVAAFATKLHAREALSDALSEGRF